MSKINPEEFNNAHREIALAYIEAILQLTALTGQDEVNYINKTFTTPEGGTYLLQFQYLYGEKISLKKWFPTEAKEAQSEENQSPKAE